MYEVRWVERAREDLLVKVSRAAASELVAVAERSLTQQPSDDDLDEGHGVPPELWRRGLTKQQRADLTAAEQRGDDSADQSDRPWNFVLVYQPFGTRERMRHGGKDGFVVLAVLSVAELAGILNK